MAIDAIIAWTRQTDEGLELDLVARNSSAGPAGQSRLTIIGPLTYTPQPGQQIWGGSDLVQIVGEPRRYYRRISYTRLEEVYPKSTNG